MVKALNLGGGRDAIQTVRSGDGLIGCPELHLSVCRWGDRQRGFHRPICGPNGGKYGRCWRVRSDEYSIKGFESDSERLMQAYFALTPNSDSKAIAHVFAMRNPDKIRWKDDSGRVPISQIASHLTPPAGPAVVSTLVASADWWSLREIWTVTPPGANSSPIYYALDMVHEPHAFDSFHSLRILDLTIITTGVPPTPPIAYCHLEVEQGVYTAGWR